jgi:lipopolysaccharide transport system permease protein
MKTDASLSAVDIRPPDGWEGLQLRELWTFRELLYFFVWRDLKVRYNETVLGVAWAVLQPLGTAAIFALVFGRLARMPSEGLPYPVWSFAGLVAWTYVSNAVSQCASSLVGNAHLITKVYFPRALTPLGAVVSGLVDYVIAFAILVAGGAALYGIVPGARLLLVPFVVVLMLSVAFAIGVWLAALNVAYRDVRYVIPFAMQFWLFATPVVYPGKLIPEPWRTIAGLNPMAGVVELTRWSVLGTPVSGPLVLTSCLVTAMLLATGLVYFRRTEHRLADVL